MAHIQPKLKNRLKQRWQQFALKRKIVTALKKIPLWYRIAFVVGSLCLTLAWVLPNSSDLTAPKPHAGSGQINLNSPNTTASSNGARGALTLDLSRSKATAAPTITDTASAAVVEVAPTPEPIIGKWQAYVVRKGDNLIAVLRSINIVEEDIQSLIAADSASQDLNKLQPGQVVSIFVTEQGDLLTIKLGAVDYIRLDDGLYKRASN